MFEIGDLVSYKHNIVDPGAAPYKEYRPVGIILSTKRFDECPQDDGWDHRYFLYEIYWMDQSFVNGKIQWWYDDDLMVIKDLVAIKVDKCLNSK